VWRTARALLQGKDGHAPGQRAGHERGDIAGGSRRSPASVIWAAGVIPNEMRQPVNGHGGRGAPERPFQLLARVPPATASALKTSDGVPGNPVGLPSETATQLQTLLTLCRSLADASTGEIAGQLAGRWMTLVQSDQPIEQSGPRPTGRPNGPGVEAQSGRHVVRVAGWPALALILTTKHPVSSATTKLLSKALALAFPILRDGEVRQREEESRQRVLRVQAKLAHELRTPLTAISGFAQLLQRPGQLDEVRRRTYAGIAVTESQQATAIIDQMVDQLQAEAEALGKGEEPGDTGQGAPGTTPTRDVDRRFGGRGLVNVPKVTNTHDRLGGL
jgi:signal transduction histidine kinase